MFRLELTTKIAMMHHHTRFCTLSTTARAFDTLESFEADEPVYRFGFRDEIPLTTVARTWSRVELQTRARGQEVLDLPPTRQFSGRCCLSPHATCQEPPDQINPLK